MNLTPDQTQRLAEKLLPMLTEMDRLKALSSIDLIREVLVSPEGDSLKVTELMDRVLPGWAETICEEES
jgi:glycerol-3-phosphate cytidylyltransferase-like family protein